MKLIFLAIFTIIIANSVFAQNGGKIEKISLASKTPICAAPPVNSAAGDVEKYVYKTYRTAAGKEKSLHVALVRPIDNLPKKKRPLIIGIHSGGFLDLCFPGACYEKYSTNILTKYFTPHGFATVSIEYRLTAPFDLKPPKIDDGVLRGSQYKALQDARDAIGFIFRNAESLGVDTENIFLIGTSAGAITALHTAFLDDSEAPVELRKTYGTLAPREKLRGVVSLAGAIYDLKYLRGKEQTPLMLVHGNRDGIVPPEKGFYLQMKHLTPVYGGKAVYQEALKDGFKTKGVFYDYGHSLPDEYKEKVFGEINQFVRENLFCK